MTAVEGQCIGLVREMAATILYIQNFASTGLDATRALHLLKSVGLSLSCPLMPTHLSYVHLLAL